MAVVPLDDILSEFTDTRGKELSGSTLANLRHKLTANIEFNLYGGGSKEEGRRALALRNDIDNGINTITASDTMDGNVEGFEHLKRAIALETISELLGFLEGIAKDGKSGGKLIKAEMIRLLCDPDRFERFSSVHRDIIRDAASGSPLLARRRLNTIIGLLQGEARHLIDAGQYDTKR